MTSYIDSFADPKSFRVCKKFNGNSVPKGSDLRRSPWVFWDRCSLFVDKDNVVWLSLPQTSKAVTVREAAIAVLTSRGKFVTLERVYTRGLTGLDEVLPINDLWDVIRVRLPNKGSGKRDNHSLKDQLNRHVTKFVESEFCKFTDNVKTDLFDGFSNNKKKKAISAERRIRQEKASLRHKVAYK